MRSGPVQIFPARQAAAVRPTTRPDAAASDRWHLLANSGCEARRSSWTRRHAASGLCSGISTRHTPPHRPGARANAPPIAVRVAAAGAGNPAKTSSEAAESPRKDPEMSSMPRTGACRSSRASFWHSTSRKRRRSLVMLAKPNCTRVAGAFPMPQLQPQCLDAGLTLAQELRTALDQGFERLFQIGRLLDFRFEITSLPKALTPHEGAARRRSAAPTQYPDPAPRRDSSRRARPARGRRISSPKCVTPMARKVCNRSTSQAVHAMGTFARWLAQQFDDLRFASGAPARASHSAARVEGAVALRAGSASRRQHASMSACSRCREPNNFTLPLISSNNALGGSMLTKEVNDCACIQSFCSATASGSVCAMSGNTAAYHSCFADVGVGVRRGRARAAAAPGRERRTARGAGSRQISLPFVISQNAISRTTKIYRAGPAALHFEQIDMRHGAAMAHDNAQIGR